MMLSVWFNRNHSVIMMETYLGGKMNEYSTY